MAQTHKLALTVGISILTTLNLGADELRMTNGSVIIGELIRVSDDTVIFNTPFAGEISIHQENIERITTDEPVTLMMEDGIVYEDRQIISTETAMLVKTEGEESALFDADDIEMVNPEPWELGEGYDWSGRISLAIEFENGNSDTSDWDFDAKTEWLSIYDRYKIDGGFEYEESGGDKVTDNWDITFQYDRFTEARSPNYRGAKLIFIHDEFTDVDLRTIASVHIGRQFYKTEKLTLSAEVGPAWVEENFIKAGHDSWPGIIWYLDLSTNVLGFGTTLFVDHEGIGKVEEPSDTILNTIIGIRFPLVNGFETSLEAEYEYDGGAPENIDKLDSTYNFRLGYAW